MHSLHCQSFGATATFAGLLLPFLSDPNIEIKCYDTQALHSCTSHYTWYVKTPMANEQDKMN
jgi:hypothetical protein